MVAVGSQKAASSGLGHCAGDKLMGYRAKGQGAASLCVV